MANFINTMVPTNKTRVPSSAIRFLYRARWFIFAFYFFAFCGCIYPAVLLSGSVSQDSKAPKGTPSAEALEVFEHYFPASASITGIIVYLRQKASVASILTHMQHDMELGQQSFMAASSSSSSSADSSPTPSDLLNSWNNDFNQTKAVYADTITDARYNMMDFNLEYYSRSEMDSDILGSAYLARNPTEASFYGEILYTLNASGPAANVFSSQHNFSLFNSFSSYRAVVFAGLPAPVGKQYTSQVGYNISVKSSEASSSSSAAAVVVPVELNHSAYIIISLKPGANDPRVVEFANVLQKKIMPELLRVHGLSAVLDFTVISAPSFFAEIGSSVGEDMTRMTTVVIPIAFVIFAVALSSGRLALLPLSVFVTSFVISMAIMYGVATSGKMGVNSLAPGIIMMFTTALTMDFCFFIASQWKRVIIEQVRELLMFGEHGAFGLGVGVGPNGEGASSEHGGGGGGGRHLNNDSMTMDAINSAVALEMSSNAGGNGGEEGGSTRSSANFNSTADFNQLLSKRRLMLGPKDELGAPVNKKKKGNKYNSNGEKENVDDYVGFEEASASSSNAAAADGGGSGREGDLTSSALFALKNTAKRQFKEWNRTVSNSNANGGDPHHPHQSSELCEEIDRIEVMKRVFSAAGKTLVVATVAIMLSALGICAFSVDLIASIGVTVIVCTFVTGVTSAVLPATLLLTFHGFFFATLERWCNVIKPENVTTPITQRYRTDSKVEESLLHHGAMLAPPPLTAGNSSINENKNGNGVSGAGEGGSGREATVTTGDDEITVATTTHRTIAQQARYDSTEAELALLKQVAETSASNTKRRTAMYRRFARFILGVPQSIVIAAVGVGVLLAIAIGGANGGDAFIYSSNVKQFIPANSPIVDGWDAFQEDFPPGQLFSYNLLQLYPSIANFSSPEVAGDFFAQQHFAVQTIVKMLPRTGLKTVEGMAFSGVLSDNLLAASGGNISFVDFATCVGMQQYMPDSLTPLCSYTLLLGNLFTSSTAIAPAITYLGIALDFDPTDQSPGEEWYDTFVSKVIPYLERAMPFVTAARTDAAAVEAAADAFFAASGKTSVAEALPPHMRIKLHLRGAPGETFDTVKYATDALTTIIAVAVPIIFIVVFFAFGSLTIALRVIVTVALTVAAVFSVTAAVYTYDVLDWLGVSSLRGHGSMMWQMPFIVILLSASVCLNYELITTAKIVDFRWKNIDGLGSTISAIETGFSIVGREVTFAGLMMMVVFFGFLLSQVSALNQIGFVLFLTAFFSAFWVRLFITPTVMGLLREANWFPLTLLPERFHPPAAAEVSALHALAGGSAATANNNHHHTNTISNTAFGSGPFDTSAVLLGDNNIAVGSIVVAGDSVANHNNTSAAATPQRLAVPASDHGSSPSGGGGRRRAGTACEDDNDDCQTMSEMSGRDASHYVAATAVAALTLETTTPADAEGPRTAADEGTTTLNVNSNGVSVTIDQTFEDM